MAQETEAKIALRDDEMGSIRARLIALGARRGRLDYEENTVFRLGDGHEHGRVRSLRLRTFAGRDDAILTTKGPVQRDCAYKSREETEVQVTDAASASALLAHLGYRPKAQYTKRREHWYLDDTVVALDRLAFGDYLEVEGDIAAIEAVLARLGLGGRPHIQAGYARLAKRSRKRSRSPLSLARALPRAS